MTNIPIFRGSSASLTRHDLPHPKYFQQWVNVQYGHDANGKRTKFPIDSRSGFAARIDDPRTFSSFQQVTLVRAQDGVGVMFAITHDDPFFVADLDHCRDPQTGAIAPGALDIAQRLNTRTTISSSGKGLHCFGIGTKPGTRCQNPRTFDGGIYDWGRFIALTSGYIPGFPRDIRDSQAALDALYPDLFPTPQRLMRGAIDHPDDMDDYGKPMSPRMTDEEIFGKLANASNAAKFRALWSGDDSFHRHNASDADASLIAMIAFYTQDRDQITRIALHSDRWREKWDRADYLPRTIDFVLAQQVERYDPSRMNTPIVLVDGNIHLILR